MAAVEVKNLTKIYSIQKKRPGFFSGLKSIFKRQYQNVIAVDDVSFSIEEGELVGFIGPNGAGKTTTLKMLSGLLYPTAGSASVLGFIPWERKIQFQKQFAFVAGQKNQLWWDLPAIETFYLNKEIYEVPDEDFKKRIDYLSSLLQIKDLLDKPVKKLSLGQRMKAELIAALIHQPKVLYLDEPTIGLDVVAQNNMHEFIKNYNQEFGATIILTSHYMGDVEKLCERVIIINKGKILYDGKFSQITSRFTRHKIIKLDFTRQVEKSQLEKYGKVLNYSLLTATLEVDRNEIAKVTTDLLEKFSIIDLSVEEPPIEEIIRNLFIKNQ